jgi:hypothetical protein
LWGLVVGLWVVGCGLWAFNRKVRKGVTQGSQGLLGLLVIGYEGLTAKVAKGLRKGRKEVMQGLQRFLVFLVIGYEVMGI